MIYFYFYSILFFHMLLSLSVHAYLEPYDEQVIMQKNSADLVTSKTVLSTPNQVFIIFHHNQWAFIYKINQINNEHVTFIDKSLHYVKQYSTTFKMNIDKLKTSIYHSWIKFICLFKNVFRMKNQPAMDDTRFDVDDACPEKITLSSALLVGLVLFIYLFVCYSLVFGLCICLQSILFQSTAIQQQP